MQGMVNLGSIFIPKEETCCSMTAFSAGSPAPVLEVYKKSKQGQKW
jgi:hypothetical protein